MNENVIPIEPTFEAKKPEGKAPHKITITIEDINVSTDEMSLDVQFDPKMEKNVPMTAALSVAQQVLELLSVIREKTTKPKS